MKSVYTAKQIEDIVLSGKSLDSLPADAVLTPLSKRLSQRARKPWLWFR